MGSGTIYIGENDLARPFKYIQDDCLSEDDREFLWKVMKFDPKDHLTAKQLLQDKWFDGAP